MHIAHHFKWPGANQNNGLVMKYQPIALYMAWVHWFNQEDLT